jgi:hypothetical protein
VDMALKDSNKIWSPIFSTKRNFSEDRPYVQTLADLQVDGDHLDQLLKGHDGGVPSCMSEEIKQYCTNTCSSLLQTGPGGKPDNAKVWLNDIELPSQKSRNYPYPLTACQLYTLLMLKV